MSNIDRTETTNTLELISVPHGEAGIKTLDELLAAAAVDLDVWRVDRWEANAWPTTMKGDDGQPISVINHQVKAKLVRIEPIRLMPTIEPVAIRIRPPKRIPPRAAGVEATLILPDPQIGYLRDMRTGAMVPYHDRRAMHVALQIAERVNPTRVIWLGDLLDLPEMSTKFLRSPDMYFTTQAAIIEAAWWLGQFRKAAPAAVHTLLEGNHDKRLETMIQDRLVAAYDLRAADELDLPPALSIPRLLALDSMGIEYVGGYPDGQVWISDDIAAEHGATVSATPGGTVGKIVNSQSVSVIHGHIHRREWASRTIYRRNKMRVIEAVCPGCLCQVGGDVPGVKQRQNWQQGIAVVYTTRGGYREIRPIAIEDGRALYDGAIVRGADVRREIVRDTGWEAL